MLTVDTLREVLPGSWRVLATTFPMWLSGRRLEPTFTYSLLGEDPLLLRDEVGYRTRAGKSRSLIGTDRFDPASGRFVWRGRGLLRAVSSRWRVVHLSDDRDVIVLTFDRSPVTPAGIDVIGRGAVKGPLPLDRLGIERAQFDELHWL